MKKVAMIFEKPELVFDIKTRAYLTAKSATQKSETPEDDDNWLIDIANKEDLMREPAGRLINLAFMEAYAKCRSLVPEGETSPDYVESDRYTEVSRYIMRLQVRDNAPMYLIRGLQDLIHEFIVYKVLQLWCEMVSRDHMEVFAVRVASIAEQIKTAMLPLQGSDGERPLFPFG